MELEQYISTGIIESFLLGLATPDEVAELQRMRLRFPALETEIAAVERRMENAAFEEAVMPPARVWEGIQQHLNWESSFRDEKLSDEERKHYTFISMQPKEGTYISVHRSWKIILILFFLLSKLFLVGFLYFYFKSQSLQDKLNEARHPQTTAATR
ncbi:hypothetical protein DCC81_01965 [Chitinophaga parva]|uniref:Anti-sigma factor n=1 Tax=Chitinophaga parva TaxID=2169414 RepID=A0A2T7BKR9_9BACT|nr:hypothetical protein [Chitinophaga parva]PUZ28274.1 hypothetical protein DCC81_01965 [Chitinophaga parva]